MQPITTGMAAIREYVRILGKDSERFAGFGVTRLTMGLPILRKRPRQQPERRISGKSKMKAVRQC
jgi:hypothetical protein